MKPRKYKASDAWATFGAWCMETAAWAITFFPMNIRYWIVERMGLCFGFCAPHMRRGLEKNLQEILNISEDELPALRNKIFKNFALTLHDFFFPGGLVLHVPEREKLEHLREKSRGILVLTFHMGHWELGARTMRQWGWPVTAVYQSYRNKKFRRMIESRRARGVNFIPVGGKAASGVREALRRGEIVAMLGDLPFGEVGSAVNLLGRRIRWPKGPVVLAVREKSPIVIAVILRSAMREYEAYISDALIPRAKTKAEVDRLVQEVADKFGKLVSQHPTQWYRFREFEFE